MEKQLLTLDDLSKVDELTIMHYAAPIIVLSVAVEWWVSIYRKRNNYHKTEFFSALTIGAVNAGIGAVLKAWLLGVSLLIYNQVPWAVPRTWWGFVICFVLIDLCRYWAHRISHEQRFWWATHVTHHSSERMNFSVSFRTGWTQHLKFVFFLPVPFLGFDPFTFFMCHQVAVLYQFWVHTELIKKLPAPVEYIFVTPSHHRVHHGSNPKYIDKNYGSTFIIWDRLFGTFVPEEERPTYGLTKPVHGFNPVHLVFHEWVDLWRDIRHSSSVKEVVSLLFNPPGAIVTAHQRQALVQQSPVQEMRAEKKETRAGDTLRAEDAA
ncbi:sterol desaturase/sphingolipid hydroxylase (fatty acid hydroxylase superfamily) [Pontibacter ummariensis]|uniref:Sterol desaturase/sphingolipid hydroxylase, fatty acid hydroxylase superfamily n=1 Tax=Pontibacter ummariensis TaxID=1610492 RepID=A0A239JNN9_9BACT|nr:sterol desaturase family protein [Pontibacter ummariensis]PRY07355.1 sterol desaturase/sphingolipid hydroxylase (fatty acid hydroxylase superfamily) [Pontibacter ummariensis]SNT07445.1 Sterol desaturase/sphingolipid hydroxylase, fatty acid hydroxylase superfamily [Pontibacter ummariensis]